jgi:hypothetical protein
MARFPQKAVDDGLRRVRRKKYSSISLLLDLHTPLFKPLNRIRGKKPVEGLPDKVLSSRIPLGHFRYLEAGMREIAPASAAQFHLGEHVAGFFNYDDFKGRIHSGGIYGTKEPGRTPANHNQTAFGHLEFDLPFPRRTYFKIAQR